MPEFWPWARDALLRFADATALVYVDCDASTAGTRSVTYAELIEMADHISRLVPGRETGVGLCLDNSLAAVACQLGVLWGGSHFVPLDQPSAQPRLRDMIDGSSIELIFCAPHLVEEVTTVVNACCRRSGIAVRSIDDHELIRLMTARMHEGDDASAATPRLCRERICTFHTSGTTGTPKPIHSTPEQWGAFVVAAAKPYHLTATSRVFVATSAIFDPSAGLTFAALAIGAAVCLAPWSFTLQHLRRAIELTRATHACSTPSVWALYDLDGDRAPADRGSLTTLMLGGEPMPAATIRTWLGLGVTLINTYGTTEATVYQWAYEVPADAAALTDAQLEQRARCLGSPFEGIEFEVVPARALLEDLVESGGHVASGGAEEPAAEGEGGELVLRGAQVGGRDRWAAPGAATSGHADGDESRFFTGDLVRCRGDGLYYLGRADQQVKLNGRRIELGPIGAAICDAMRPLVRRAVVLLIDGKLHAFCVVDEAPRNTERGNTEGGRAGSAGSPGYAVTADAVRVLCGLELPAHLVPSGVTLIGDLPRTPTGKTDARALTSLLRAPTTAASADEAVARDGEGGVGGAPWCPEGWLAVVATCWSHELGIPVGQLSATSNFRTLSGDSLVALKICKRLWRHHQDRRAAGSPDGRAEGGEFGELMGSFGPVNLLTTPALSEYAAMLQADAGAAVAEDEGTLVAPSPTTDKARPSELDHLLLAAVCANHDECTALMLRHGASPNAASAGSAITALQSSLQHKDTALAHRLLAACADVLAVDGNQQTAIHHAARAGADNGCLLALLSKWSEVAGTGDGAACESLDVWGRSALHWATMNGHREAIVTLVEAGSDISLRDRQNESSLDLAERRAACRGEVATGRCDRLTIDMLRLMLPADHADHRSFHPDGIMDLCTHEVLRHAERMKLSPEEREAFLALTPAEREAIGDHAMTIDELKARDDRIAASA